MGPTCHAPSCSSRHRRAPAPASRSRGGGAPAEVCRGGGRCWPLGLVVAKKCVWVEMFVFLDGHLLDQYEWIVRR